MINFSTQIQTPTSTDLGLARLSSALNARPWQPRAATGTAQHHDQLQKRTKVATDPYERQSPPMPETTKKAGKRKKYPKPPSMRQPNQIGLIFRIGTDCKIADEATEARLKRLGPSTSVRHGGMQFIW